jgi:glycosyltransferase involved in cell wall biosynthesis
MNSQKSPFFSFIIPLFKTEPFLEQCLNSLINQTFEDFECILVNDGSPGINLEDLQTLHFWHRKDFENQFIPKQINPKDQAKYIFDQIAGQDTRFRYFEKSNTGLSDTKNFALQKVKGQYLVILDSDDYLQKDYLQNAFEAIKKNTTNKIIYANLKTLENEKFGSFKQSQKFLPDQNNLKTLLLFPTWSATPVNYFWSIEQIIKNNIKFQKKGEDTCFLWDNIFTHLKDKKSPEFEFISDSYYIYRQFENQMTKGASFQTNLFEATTSYTNSKLNEFYKLSFRYGFLAQLFVWRFRLHRQKLLSGSKINKLFFGVFAKILTLFSFILSSF